MELQFNLACVGAKLFLSTSRKKLTEINAKRKYGHEIKEELGCRKLNEERRNWSLNQIIC
jgi:hypothetical protein